MIGKKLYKGCIYQGEVVSVAYDQVTGWTFLVLVDKRLKDVRFSIDLLVE